MTAKEMLEELGYELSFESDRCLDYQMINRRPDSNHVVFDLLGKRYYHEEYDTPGNTSVALHLAITQQMKELGWLE